MNNPFDSPKLTLVRAQNHINDFNRVVDEFVQGRPWTYVIDKDTEPGRHIHKIKFTLPLPPILPCILFDVANNLRATLDQTGYAAAIADGKTNPKKTNFPFGDDPAGLDNNISGRKVCSDLRPEVVTLFRGFNSYKGGNDPLWALNKICNTKKHCALVPLQISKALAHFSGDIVGDGWVASVVSPASSGIGWDPAKNEINLMIGPAGLESKIAADVAFGIAIGGIDTVSDEQARHVLAAMSGLVERILLQTEAECVRLGLIPKII